MGGYYWCVVVCVVGLVCGDELVCDCGGLGIVCGVFVDYWVVCCGGGVVCVVVW